MPRLLSRANLQNFVEGMNDLSPGFSLHVSLPELYQQPQLCQEEVEEPKEVPPEPAFAQDGWDGYQASTLTPTSASHALDLGSIAGHSGAATAVEETNWQDSNACRMSCSYVYSNAHNTDPNGSDGQNVGMLVFQVVAGCLLVGNTATLSTAGMKSPWFSHPVRGSSSTPLTIMSRREPRKCAKNCQVG